MSEPERPAAAAAREVDPLLKDLTEKQQNFRRNVVSLAAELKEARSRLTSQELSFAKETRIRQEAEAKAKNMDMERDVLGKSIEERNTQLQASKCAIEMYVKELDDLRLQLSAARATAEASACSAESAQQQCSVLVKELEEKNWSLKEHKVCVNKLVEQLDLLRKDLHVREFSNMQRREEVERIEHEIMQSVTRAGEDIDCELRKILDDASLKNLKKLNKLFLVKDEETTKLRDEIRAMSAHWKLKTEELESQLEKHHRADQELKKKVLKLEFCLQEAHAETRKLQRMGERRDRALNELRYQLSAKQRASHPANNEKQHFWETSGFKIAISVSILILVMFSKR